MKSKSRNKILSVLFVLLFSFFVLFPLYTKAFFGSDQYICEHTNGLNISSGVNPSNCCSQYGECGTYCTNSAYGGIGSAACATYNQRVLCSSNPLASGCPSVYPKYNCISNPSSKECILFRLGVTEVDLGDVLVKRSPINFIKNILIVLLGIVVVIVVFRIVLAGISIANAKEDADKRKDGFQKVVSAGIGLAVSFLSYGLTLGILNFTGVQNKGEVLLDCKELAAKGYSADVVARCEDLAKNP